MKRLLMCLVGSALILGFSIGNVQAGSHKGDPPGKGVKKPNENSNSQMSDDATKARDRAAERRNDKAASNSGNSDKGKSQGKHDDSDSSDSDRGGRRAGKGDGAEQPKSPHKRDGGSSLEIDLEPDQPVAEQGFFDRMATLFGMESESPK